MSMTRRRFVNGAATVAAVSTVGTRALGAETQAMPAGRVATSAERQLAKGPFQPTWDSLRGGYQTPDWFRDAKFGIWAHWSAQCVPEQGDWYARNMYMQGHPQYDFHVKTYGHPSKVGFKDIDTMWKVDAWRPDDLIELYHNAGAKYFMALANHHDNFDCYRSKYQPWNSTRLGPMRDIVGTWGKLARAKGMRFAVSNHSSHAWHWLQPAFGHDVEGPLAGVRYDAATVTAASSKGTPWAGFDPTLLYVGPAPDMVLPDDIKTPADARKWHASHDGKWHEDAPPSHPEFVNRWFLRLKDLVDTYQPDLVYFDDTELPFEQTGLDFAAHYYNASVAKKGKVDVVVTAKGIRPEHKGAVVLDFERGKSDKILDLPWQTDTCIGEWHYKRSLYEQHKYRTAKNVVQTLCDVVSKNGNLCLNIPVRGNGEIDSDERAIVEQVGAWMKANNEGIYGSRPFSQSGEGAKDEAGAGNFNEGKGKTLTPEDIRFTTKGGKLYAYSMGAPADGVLRIKTLGKNGTTAVKSVARVELLGASAPLKYEQTDDALLVTLPESVKDVYAVGLKIFSANSDVKGSV